MPATVAIVGRPNVGKSRLFNRLSRKRIAIVHDQPGITRDVLSAHVEDGDYTLLDTGGLGLKGGDTPASISRKYGVKLDTLMAANPGLDARHMKIGQTINIPAP